MAALSAQHVVVTAESAKSAPLSIPTVKRRSERVNPKACACLEQTRDAWRLDDLSENLVQNLKDHIDVISANRQGWTDLQDIVLRPFASQ